MSRSSYDAWLESKELARKGISVQTSLNKHCAPICSQKTGQRGRPTKNIFSGGLSNDPGKKNISDPVLKRAILLAKHKAWKSMHRSRGWHDDMLPSVWRKSIEHPIWTVYWVAELAWILMGHKAPSRQFGGEWYINKRVGFFQETHALWFFLNAVFEQSVGARKGPKRDAEKYFKTALAAFVARKFVQPKGGHWTKLPTPREISQVWYVLFGEKESHDNIKPRLDRLASLLTAFPDNYPAPKDKEFSYFPKLGKALKHRLDKRNF